MRLRDRLQGMLLFAVALLLSSAVGAAPPEAVPAVPVFGNHTGGYACFRIPAMIRTPRGVLLAFAEARRNSCDDFGDVRIVMRRSRDEGKTWGPLEMVAENGTLQAGNPAPVVDTMDRRYPHGRIFMVYCTGDAPENAIMRGEGSRRIWYRTSTDDGGTWSQPVEITGSVKTASWRHYATGPGHALQLTHGQHAGRIFVAANHSEGEPQPKGHDYAAHAFYSDDHGATWRLSQTVAWPGSNESTAAETDTGDVVMNIRDQSKASRARIIALSSDGGGVWNKVFVAEDLPDPVCEGSMISYRVKGHGLLIFTNAGSRTDRRDLTVSISTDGGLSWSKHTLIEAGPAAYSDVALLKGKSLGVLWERGNAGGIYFTVRPLDLLLQ
jgi:sialidase-1